MTHEKLPLDGVRVLDLSRVLTGPYCTMVMGDLGAEIIKVERPGHGDDTRTWGPPWFGSESAYFISANRNKKSIAVNLKTEQGKQIIYDLAKTSDVVVENFRVGVTERLGIDYETLKDINPKLVYASITGFGQEGPKKDFPGYDAIIQGMGGIMSITGPEPGYKVGVAIDDITAGLFATIAITSALYRRNSTGKGEYIDVSLLDSQVAWLANIASNYLITKEVPQRYGNAHASIVPYQSIKASDEHFMLAVGNDKQWRRLCKLIKKPELKNDERTKTNSVRVKNREFVINQLKDVFKTKPADHWVRALYEVGIPAGPINKIKETFNDPQVEHRNMKVKAKCPKNFDVEDREVELVGSPINLKESESIKYKAPPLLGQHTEEILSEILKYSADKIHEYKHDKIVE